MASLSSVSVQPIGIQLPLVLEPPRVFFSRLSCWRLWLVSNTSGPVFFLKEIMGRFSGARHCAVSAAFVAGHRGIVEKIAAPSIAVDVRRGPPRRLLSDKDIGRRMVQLLCQKGNKLLPCDARHLVVLSELDLV